MGGRTTGREEYKQTINRYWIGLTDFHTRVIDTIEQDDRLVFRFITTGMRDNSRFVFEAVNIPRVAGDKVVEDWVYFDATAVRGRELRAATIRPYEVKVRGLCLYEDLPSNGGSLRAE